LLAEEECPSAAALDVMQFALSFVGAEARPPALASRGSASSAAAADP